MAHFFRMRGFVLFLFSIPLSVFGGFKEEVSGAMGRGLYVSAAGIMEARHAGSEVHLLSSKQKAFLAPILGNWVNQAEIIYNADLMDKLGSFKIWGKHHVLRLGNTGAQTYGYRIYMGESESGSFDQMALLT